MHTGRGQRAPWIISLSTILMYCNLFCFCCTIITYCTFMWMLCDGGSVQIGGSGLLGCVFSRAFRLSLSVSGLRTRKKSILICFWSQVQNQSPQQWYHPWLYWSSKFVLLYGVKTELFANFLVKKVHRTIEEGLWSGSAYCTVQARAHKTNTTAIIWYQLSWRVRIHLICLSSWCHGEKSTFRQHMDAHNTE
jgi:hypothetical protein